MEKEYMINSKLVKQLRKKSGWSQEQFANASGLSLRTIQRIEAEGKASLETKVCVAATLQIQLDELEIPTCESEQESSSPKLQFNTGFLVLFIISLITSVAGYFVEFPKPITFLSNFTAVFCIIFVAFKAYFFNQVSPSFWYKSAITGGFICASLFSLFSLFGNVDPNSKVPLFLSLALFCVIAVLVAVKQKYKP